MKEKEEQQIVLLILIIKTTKTYIKYLNIDSYLVCIGHLSVITK